MKEQIKQFYLDSPNVKNIVDCLEVKRHVSCLGLTGSAKSYVVAATAEKVGGHNFIICSDKERAAYFYNDLENIYGEKDAE